MHGDSKECPLAVAHSQYLGAHFLNGTFELPSVRAMEKDVMMREKYMNQYADRLYRRSCVGALQIWPAIYRSGFKCERCNKPYTSKNIYLDLTVTAGTKNYTEYQPARTELFRSPLVSFLYERGWRQNFNRSGFPGPDEEFKMAQEYFKPAEGGVLVDVSCGSGLFSRKFAKSGTYAKVIALDFSENMLRQCYDFIKNDDTILDTNLALVRADVSRLPFASGSVDAVHAGAALHCWPSPSNAIAEINRILRSGGIFVGTTFLRFSSATPEMLRPFRQVMLITHSLPALSGYAPYVWKKLSLTEGFGFFHKLKKNMLLYASIHDAMVIGSIPIAGFSLFIRFLT
ncbi:S-adenosyl-L-methionine-dependent methyltransferases superfamily protein [Actinidia rufa]|uniref:S-adenosyl-L-methionine-dependent methyltransferases superfamily protein n=1 Tax=Actinidia rufa TaxID=165716 RepID=A0A7J0E2R0_9ERIC|nr:S-adenosyl-L-methionine-dependent methyltransferases superfamily protein [Actinidia rufa]